MGRQQHPSVRSAQSGRSRGPGRQRVIRRGAALSGLAAAAAVVAACGSAGGSTSSGVSGNSRQAAPGNAAVSAHRLTGIGAALVNSSGMTLYTPKTPMESSGHIKCTGPCVGFWIPATPSAAMPAASALPGKVATIHRPDGKTQLTYNGRPLYTFRLDTAPGQDHGNGFHDSFNGTNFTWQVVTASGKPSAAHSPAPAPSYSY